MLPSVPNSPQRHLREHLARISTQRHPFVVTSISHGVRTVHPNCTPIKGEDAVWDMTVEHGRVRLEPVAPQHVAILADAHHAITGAIDSASPVSKISTFLYHLHLHLDNYPLLRLDVHSYWAKKTDSIRVHLSFPARHFGVLLYLRGLKTFQSTLSGSYYRLSVFP
ncbi:hypothetical protein FBULB1_2936 [Fusarium bulbicola]|nr:hypothetical protein FBULB1_2936 [Fusarium bulbicola]